MRNFLLTALLLTLFSASAQEKFTRKDSLQGGLRIERECFDVLHYNLDLRVDIPDKSLSGSNEITFKVVSETDKIQIDLFENMKIERILSGKKELKYEREFGAVFIAFPDKLQPGSEQKITVFYSGKPKEAPRAPWQGGFVWKESAGKPFVGVAVQGTGASLWYPVKDSQSDEPDLGATISISAPTGLTAVSNGRLKKSVKGKDGFTKWIWEVKSPINTYDITLNVADYAHISETYKGLDLDYYVLSDNKKKAAQHFQGVKPMLDCFHEKFGPYPFAKDGYKLVETPYLGMEHQSAVAYGNEYKMGYKGSDLSGTGIGLLFDYIIVHESGHEWFGNSITSKDIADMWIHEGFTMYSEAVYVECTLGKEKAYEYLNGIRKNIHNYDPVIGQYGVNNQGSGDMYPKGAWLLHTIRNVVNDDAKWWAMLRKYCETFRHKIITTKDVSDFFSAETGMNLTPVFDQYLRTTNIPVLTLRSENGKIFYNWGNVSDGFAMPVDVEIEGKRQRLYPTTTRQELQGVSDMKSVKTRPDLFLIDTQAN